MVLLIDGSSPVLVPSLQPYSNYSVEVAAFTVGLGPYSSAEVVQTAEDGMQGVQIHFSMQSDYVHLEWKGGSERFSHPTEVFDFPERPTSTIPGCRSKINSSNYI